MKTRYVVGFMFNDGMTSVALIRKQKPEWQKGLLNGIGGKREAREKPLDAMRREFREESGVQHDNWRHFCSMAGINNDGEDFEVEFFYTRGDLSKVCSQEAEQIEIVPVYTVTTGTLKTIGNLPWLVALALDFGKGVHPPSKVRALYFGNRQG